LDETLAAVAQEFRANDNWKHWANRAKALCFAMRLRPHIAEDVLQTTIKLVCDGSRRWPKEVSWNAFFFGAMHSAADNMRRKESRIAPPEFADMVPPPQNVEQEAICDQLEALFEAEIARDPDLWRFYQLKRLEYELSEIGLILNLDSPRVEALRKRYERFVRQWMARHLKRK